MHNLLLKTGILLPSGEISKDKINLISGAITKPFAEMVWVTTGGDRDTLNRMTEVFVSMNTTQDRERLFKIIQMLYGLMGLRFSDEAALMAEDSAALEYFVLSFLLDFGEIIRDYLAEDDEALA